MMRDYSYSYEWVEPDASRTMCAVEFDARTIYDAYVARVTAPIQNS